MFSNDSLSSFECTFVKPRFQFGLLLGLSPVEYTASGAPYLTPWCQMMGVSCFADDSDCFPRMPLQKLPNLQDKKSVAIYRDLKFKCQGEIAAWKFHATSAGTVYFSVWSQKQGKYYIKGRNMVTVIAAGEQTAFVPMHR